MGRILLYSSDHQEGGCFWKRNIPFASMLLLLFEKLLQQYEPFLDAWVDLGNEEDEVDELYHDEIEDEDEE